MEKIDESPIAKKARKGKMVKEFPEEDIFKLISLVEVHKCIWDASDEAYHNKGVRDCAWKTICDNFNEKYNVSDLHTKWSNLRIQYRGYAARVKTKSGQGAVETPKWTFFSAMNFVRRAEELQSHPTVSNLMISESESSSLDHDAIIISSTPLVEQKFASTKRQQQTGNASAASQIAETMREAVTVMREGKENYFDPNINFSKYLVSELKSLSEDSAATVRNRVTVFFCSVWKRSG